MAYHLLTGATGLLGAYLLRDALAAGHRIAVVARASTLESPRQRVETLLARWERIAGHALPRPVVLEGDISRPGLGLGDREAAWVARHCHAVLHNAASLTFQTNPKTNEPWRSNVDGTRNVLELCRQLGLRQFHHVSTAYVCGLRHGTIYEHELDEGQEMANDYERSKIESEKMVRQAAFLERATVYRPAIITGDAQSGYTSTFHGFYTPLKVLHGISAMIDPATMDAGPLMRALGIRGEDSKNFVPVDWVSAVLVHILGRPEHHGKTYHLTPGNRVRVGEWAEICKEVLRHYIGGRERPTLPSPLPLELVFREQMDVYSSYWRDDPQFDASNTAAAAPHLPCPTVDRTMIVRLSKFAFDTNFGWPRPRPVKPAVEVAERLAAARNGWRPTTSAEAAPRVGLEINGAGGGAWTLAVGREGIAAVEEGAAPPGPTVYLNTRTFGHLLAGEMTSAAAIAAGRVLVERAEGLPLSAAAILDEVVRTVAAESAAATAGVAP